MILRGFKNFLKGIKCYFTPLGLITIFATIALTISLGGIFNAVKNLFTSLGETIGKSSIDWGNVGDTLINAGKEVNWSLEYFTNIDWIINALTAALMNSGLGETISSAKEAIASCASTIISMIIVFIVLMVVGLVTGYVFLSIQVRYTLIRDEWWKVLLCCLLDALVQLVVIALLVLLVVVFLPFIFVAPLLMLIITEILSILGAYFIHAYKKVRFKEIFKFKTIALCTLTDLILLISGVILILLVFLIFKTFVALVIGLPLFEILLIVSRLTAETYVVDKLKEKPQIDNKEYIKQ